MLAYRLATEPAEFDAIHALNYETFVEEIPQHQANAERKLVDRFHAENTYAIGLADGELAGMVAGRSVRPFSLDAKVGNLDAYLPTHRKVVEIRLLAVRRRWRHRGVFARLLALIASHFIREGCDLAVISGTVRQLALYEHLGFRAFGGLVGPPDAQYQPMYLTLAEWSRSPASRMREPESRRLCLQPGPVAIAPGVLEALARPPRSHRAPRFVAELAKARHALCRLTGASHAALLLGSGTLANEAVAAQLRLRDTEGLVLANGEFGERLGDHALRWGLRHRVARQGWGRPFDWHSLQKNVLEYRPKWIWATLSETSTVVRNSLGRLRTLSASVGADLCLDAISAIGLEPVDLRGVCLSTAVSGKGLASVAGLAAVLHDGRLAPAGRLPAYVDLAGYETAWGVPFTQSSNLVEALNRALETDWPTRFARIAAATARLRGQLRAAGLPPLAPDHCAMPGILTIPLPASIDSTAVGRSLALHRVDIAFQSSYLKNRNWVQLCLMGELDEAALETVPELLARSCVHGNVVPRRSRR